MLRKHKRDHARQQENDQPARHGQETVGIVLMPHDKPVHPAPYVSLEHVGCRRRLLEQDLGLLKDWRHVGHRDIRRGRFQGMHEVANHEMAAIGNFLDQTDKFRGLAKQFGRHGLGKDQTPSLLFFGICRSEFSALMHHDQNAARPCQGSVDLGFKGKQALQIPDRCQALKTEQRRAHLDAKSLDQIQMSLLGRHEALMGADDLIAMGLLHPEGDNPEEHERQHPQDPPLAGMKEMPGRQPLHTARPRKKMSTRLALAARQASAQAVRVAPVVMTSSTSSTCRPDKSAAASNAPATLRCRSARPRLDWAMVSRVLHNAPTIGARPMARPSMRASSTL
jgi:hypothetical protein